MSDEAVTGKGIIGKGSLFYACNTMGQGPGNHANIEGEYFLHF